MIQPREIPDINSDCEILVDINIPRDNMRCPACGAHRSGRLFCHRCKSDLSSLVEIERHGDMLYERALVAYAHGRFRTAQKLAAESLKLVDDIQTMKLHACAALRAGDFPAAREAGHVAQEGTD